MTSSYHTVSMYLPEGANAIVEHPSVPAVSEAISLSVMAAHGCPGSLVHLVISLLLG